MHSKRPVVYVRGCENVTIHQNDAVVILKISDGIYRPVITLPPAKCGAYIDIVFSGQGLCQEGSIVTIQAENAMTGYLLDHQTQPIISTRVLTLDCSDNSASNLSPYELKLRAVESGKWRVRAFGHWQHQ